MTQPQASTADLARAAAHLVSRDWQAAHEIVQHDKSKLAAWLHGIVHTLEGDLDNARYWYRRAGRAFPGPEGVGAEIARARDELGGETGRAEEKG